MRKLITILTLLALTFNCTAQITDPYHWKINSLKFDSIIETTIYYRDTVNIDTSLAYKFVFDTTGVLVEKQYNFRSSSHVKYTSEIYQYNEQGELINIEIKNPFTPFLHTGTSVEDTKCIYYNTNGNIDEIIQTWESNNKTSTYYKYKEFTVQSSSRLPAKTIELPVKVEIFIQGNLIKVFLINYFN